MAPTFPFWLTRSLFLLALSLLATGCGREPAAGRADGQPGFRVRSDFAAALNADQGWAGALNENVTVQADRPFRVRFEVARPATAATAASRYRLQYRRNAGDWSNVEAHDFPHPLAELGIDFANVPVGSPPEGWSIVQGRAAGVAVAADGADRILRVEAGRESLTALYTPPWESEEIEFVTRVRIPGGNPRGVALVFGYVDALNHCRVLLDVASGSVRVSRLVDGAETAVTERKAAVVVGQWLDLEIQYRGSEVEVNFGNDAVEFTANLGAPVPFGPLGFHVPADGTAEFQEFKLAGEPKTPRVSVVSVAAYEAGSVTTDLLTGSAASFQPGVGLNLGEKTPSWSGTDVHTEFEWPLVVRRFADGAVTNEEGDTFELRVVDAEAGLPVSTRSALLRLAIPPGHVGGTFVETPGRIGPWQAANGDLYFIMEPAETSNLFMMIKSSDNGLTWREVDGANRPATGDLESVDGRQIGDTIHIVHQVTRSSRYHAFRTSDHPTHPDTWAVRDEVGGRADSFAQAASIVVRSDGSMVIFHVGQATVHASVRSPSGIWAMDTVVDVESASAHAVLGANDVIHLAYYGLDGTLWYRRMAPDGTFTAKETLAVGAGTSRSVYGAVLPLVFDPENNIAFILYRLANGQLWKRRVVNEGPLTPAVQVTDRNVVTDAVDSQQPGADVVFDRGTLHVLFIEASSRSIFSTHNRGGWQSPTLQVENIQGSWVRGNVVTRPDGVPVYGYVYDAGSDGGAGMNRFGALAIP